MRYVLYHGNCYDGFGAAYAAWKKLGDGTKYIPVSYGKPPPEMPDATEIYIVDFSYDEATLLGLSSHSKVFVLDHHKTALENLKGLLYLQDCNQNPNLWIEFDMNRSGAKMTWEYFHSDESGAAPYNALIEHISDRDLWKFEMPGSKEVHSALVSLPFDFEVWDKLKVDELILEGAACLRFESSVVDKIVKGSWIGEVDGQQVPMVNTAAHWSEVGHALLEKYPDAKFVAAFTVFKEQVMWSLRSRPGFDVSAVAKKYGGGGHAQAAGFKSVRP